MAVEAVVAVSQLRRAVAQAVQVAAVTVVASGRTELPIPAVEAVVAEAVRQLDQAVAVS
jgi:hypothetical protein